MALSSICIASALRLTLWAVEYYESCADVQMFIQIKCTLKRGEGENGNLKGESGKVKTESGKVKTESGKLTTYLSTNQSTRQLVSSSTRQLTNQLVYSSTRLLVNLSTCQLIEVMISL